MGCGNSKAVATVPLTSSPQPKPGPASNETNNNQSAGQPSKVPQNDATESANTEGTLCKRVVQSKFAR